MAMIQRDAGDDFDAFLVASAFDKHGFRVVAIVPPQPPRERWQVYGQGDPVDYDEVDATTDRLRDGTEQP
jgi:hypothetical protein